MGNLMDVSGARGMVLLSNLFNKSVSPILELATYIPPVKVADAPTTIIWIYLHYWQFRTKQVVENSL
jgi:hypothetical protein